MTRGSQLEPRGNPKPIAGCWKCTLISPWNFSKARFEPLTEARTGVKHRILLGLCRNITLHLDQRADLYAEMQTDVNQYWRNYGRLTCLYKRRTDRCTDLDTELSIPVVSAGVVIITGQARCIGAHVYKIRFTVTELIRGLICIDK